MRNPIKNTFAYFDNQALIEKRNFGLDFMRGIGVLMVLIGHSLHFFDPFFPKIHRLSHFVFNGVELFFSLSGFLIGGMLIKMFVMRNDYSISNVFTFLKRRWFKTLPVYYLAIIINLIAAYFITGYYKDFSWKHLFFIQNLFQSDFWFFPISYSLAMEEWFYLLFPILFVLLALLFRKKNPFAIMLALCVLYILVSLVIRTHYFNELPHWDAVMRKSLITRIDCSVYGVMMALFYYKFKEQFFKFKNMFFVLACILYVVSIYYRITAPLGYYYYVLYFTFIPLSFAFFIPLLQSIKPKEGIIYSFFTFLSYTAFAFYLFHLSPFMEVFLKYLKESDLLVTSVCFLLYVVLVFSVTTFWYRYVEKPFTDLREKY